MRLRTGLPAAVAAVTLGLTGTGCDSRGPVAASPGHELRLAASISLTGALAREGLQTRSGYELCERVVNDRGGVRVGGANLRLKIEVRDDTSQPDTAAQLVDQLHDQGYRLLLGPYGSAATEAVAAVVERNGQVMSEGLGTDDRIFQKGYRRIFAVASPASAYGASIVRAVHELARPSPRSVVFLSADDGFSKTATAGAERTARELGLVVLPTQYFPSGTSDVSSALIKVKLLHPDLIIGSVHFLEGVAIIKQGKELGVRPMAFGETIAPATPDFPKTLGRLGEGVLGSSQWVASGTGRDAWFGTAAAYAAAYRARYGEEPQYHAATASAACLALVLAVEKAGTIDADAVRDTLAALDVDSFYGRIAFNAAGQNVTKPMAVIQIQGGRAVPVWPAAIAERPLTWPGAP